MRVAESIILDASLAEDASKPFTAYPHGRLLNRPRGYLRVYSGVARRAGRYCALARGLSCAGEAAGAEGKLGAGGRCDLFWWGNMAAETDCTELNN